LLVDAVGAWAVEHMRGKLLLVPLWSFPTHSQVYEALWPVLQAVDGLFLPAAIAGTDWYACWKAREREPGPEQWSLSWEIALMQLATSMGMPILAIADGAEKWNGALGGTRGEAPEDAMRLEAPPSPERWEQQTIRVRAHSHLATSLSPALARQEGEQSPWNLVLLPGQRIERLAPGLRSCAQSEHGALMAFERRDGVFGLGMLGRLDWGLEQSYSMALFDAFLQACRAFAQRRQHSRTWEAERERICATVSARVTEGQPLLAVPPVSEGAHARPRSVPLASVPEAAAQEQLRQRPRFPTKEELNTMRRKRLKGG
jgi:gamma-glutamyl-gamma-aminobutyrate hydrolase PuuD